MLSFPPTPSLPPSLPPPPPPSPPPLTELYFLYIDIYSVAQLKYAQLHEGIIWAIQNMTYSMEKVSVLNRY